jgi:shikimate kinase
MLVFLIGYRGTGKSIVARLLAEKLGYGYSDADAELARRHGQSIREIFAAEGEGGFRDKEAAVLADLASIENHVVATGGGVILRLENRAQLRTGKVIWLTAPADVLWRRLQQDSATPGQRPNLAQGGLVEIEDLLRVREPLYAACADWVVDTATMTPQEVADAIYQWLGK